MTSDSSTASGLDFQRFLLLILFAGSGAAALIYEIVWYQLLQLAIGSTAVSLGILLATFMGGLCIGSYLLPRYLPRTRMHPVMVYAVIEAGIAALGLLQLVLIPLIDDLYARARKRGAVGGKILGAGGGGFLLLFAEPGAQPAIRAALSDLVHVPMRFESEGSKVVLYQPSGL